MALNTVAELIEALRRGRMVVLMDDEERENEGDLVMAAACVEPEHINFMARHARGLICLSLSPKRCRQLDLPPMVDRNRSPFSTNFTVSIDAAEGISTGISAADRAHTIRTAVAHHARPEHVVHPGHVFPICAEPGGVLTRAGHTEAGADLARMAGFEPAAVIVEIMKEDGTMARRSDLEAFAAEHDLLIGTIADLIEYRILHERTVECTGGGTVQTRWGEFQLSSFRDRAHGGLHLALVRGEVGGGRPVPVRVHVPELVRDVIRVEMPGARPGWSVARCLEYIEREGEGVLVLIGRSQTEEELGHSLRAALGEAQPVGAPSINTRLMVGIGAQILRELGVSRMRLMAQAAHYNIAGFGLEVMEYLEPPEDGETPS